jgi:hypothetical protein
MPMRTRRVFSLLLLLCLVCADVKWCSAEDRGLQQTSTGVAASDRDAGSNVAIVTDRIQFIEAVCLTVAREAMVNQIPAEFFARLIWQESRFNPDAQSYKGAQGIAQFMPGTARWRGLADSFEPFQAVRTSARWLRELRDQFGNLGLAAAAYNAGPTRVQSWLSHRTTLPAETERYVRIVTGHSAKDWLQDTVKEDDKSRFKFIPCNEIAKHMTGRRNARMAVAPNASMPRAELPLAVRERGRRPRTRRP